MTVKSKQWTSIYMNLKVNWFIEKWFFWFSKAVVLYLISLCLWNLLRDLHSIYMSNIFKRSHVVFLLTGLCRAPSCTCTQSAAGQGCNMMRVMKAPTFNLQNKRTRTTKTVRFSSDLNWRNIKLKSNSIMGKSEVKIKSDIPDKWITSSLLMPARTELTARCLKPEEEKLDRFIITSPSMPIIGLNVARWLQKAGDRTVIHRQP